MNKDELIRVTELAESKIFKNSENLRRLVFDGDFSSPLLEEIVQQMKIDLDLILSASRQLGPMINSKSKDADK